AALVRPSSSRHVSSCGWVACASGDELLSLGFRVGNPSAIGWHQWANFPASLLPVGVTPTTSRRIATRSLRRKMARSPSRAGGQRIRRQLTEPSPRDGVFFYTMKHRGGGRSSRG